MFANTNLSPTMASFSYFKLLPVPLTFINQNIIRLNGDYSLGGTKMDISVSATLFYESFASFANCQFVDFFTMQCLKCTNG